MAALLSLACFALAPYVHGSLSAEASKAPDAQAASTAAASKNATAPGGLEAARSRLTVHRASSSLSARVIAEADALEPLSSALLRAEFAAFVADPAASRELSVQAARLFLILGRYEESAASFEAAARRFPEKRDDALLLLAARCRLAWGDATNAGELAALVLLGGVNETAKLSARLIAAWVALMGGKPEEARILAASVLAASVAKSSLDTHQPGEFSVSALRREALFLVWAASSEEARKAAAKDLRAEFPESAEAAIAGAPTADQVAARLPPLPHWYLSGIAARPASALPKPGSIVAGTLPSTAPPNAAQSPTHNAPAAFPSADVSTAPLPSSAPAAQGTPTSPVIRQGTDKGAVRFQVGVFSKAENAERLVAELKKKDIQASVEKKSAKVGELFAVLVDGGKDPDATRLRLKDSGYEAYPIF